MLHRSADNKHRGTGRPAKYTAAYREDGDDANQDPSSSEEVCKLADQGQQRRTGKKVGTDELGVEVTSIKLMHNGRQCRRSDCRFNGNSIDSRHSAGDMAQNR
ncbi:hypothetical protein SUNI508_11168 [Seiridium unicorne]|uniref:Uncharacterized protein n=1 Tax=Seiridium unicorne TaxID=138068 RepID=A0ABR2UIJ3_9PEZI